jgi:ubiquinone/menaquinone biosynthesis C-methylase UbiE
MEAFLNPEKILDELDLKEGMLAAEFGCGAGGFTIPLAKRLKGGRVYALDIQEEALSALKGRLEAQRLSHVKVRRCNLEAPEGSGLSSYSLNLVLLVNFLFQINNKEQVLKEAKRILGPEGKILIVDWLPEARFGPINNRIQPDDLKKMAKDLNLKLEKEFKTGSYHYGMIFMKEANSK